MEQELWRKCVRWLIDTGVLPRQHKTTLRDSQIFDLAQTLRDGVVLCNLLNVIKPGAVDLSQINIRPQMLQFLCIQNLRTVIQSLHNVFGIPQKELFLPSDLYNMTNFRKVLNVLSLLSRSQISSSKFRPFSADSGHHRNSTFQYEDDDEEEIYRNLPDLASERELVDEEDNLYDSVAVEEEKEEGIYGSLIAVQKPQSAPKDKRSYCLNEIYETEKNYVQHLEMMQEKFIQPLRSVFDDKDIRIVFSNIEQLLPVHQEFLKIIKQEKSENAMKMSQPFLNFKDRFLKYGIYCSNLQDALSHLTFLMSNEVIRIRVEDCQNKASHSKFKLSELLCVSMQRILKYHLLVKELHKHTNESDPDKGDLSRALEAMQELSHYVNEVKRDSEMQTTINKVESCMVDYSMQLPLSAYGHLLKDGDLKIKSQADNKSKARFTYLFDQAIFMTSLKGDTYKLKDLVRLEDYILDEMPQSKAGKWLWNWSLKGEDGSNNYILYAKTEGDKMKWLESIKTAFDNINPSVLKGKPHHFKMATFRDPTYCFHCKKLLLGSFYQGYRCDRTQTSCHKLCLAETWKAIENSVNAGVPVSPSNSNPPTPGPRPGSTYKAHRDYSGTPRPPFPGANFITFRQGETVEVLDEVRPDWWMGCSIAQYSRKGYFPSSFVSPMSTRPKSSKPKYELTTPGKPLFSPPVPDRPASTSSLEDFAWYAGTLDRNEAERLLSDKPSGTFLVRSRDEHLAISLVFRNEMKHIKILQSQNMYYVAECKNFRSVQELVKYYQDNLMNTSFLGLDTTLKIPFRDPDFFPSRPLLGPHRLRQKSEPNITPIPHSHGVNHNSTFNHHSFHHHPGRRNGPRQINVNGRVYDVQGQARVLYDFEPRSTQELGLKASQLVNIISKAGDEHGWWKGEYNGRVGYFPSSFIQEL